MVVCQDRWFLMAVVSQDRFHCTQYTSIQSVVWILQTLLKYFRFLISIQESLSKKATLFDKNCGHIRDSAFDEREKYMHW